MTYSWYKGEKTVLKLEKLPFDFTVCQVREYPARIAEREFSFTARTDEEYSLVCRTEDVPDTVTAREDGWRAFRIAGVLAFSLVGILAGIAAILAAEKIGIFAVSTFNTDYVFVKKEAIGKALDALADAGYTVV